MIGRAFDPEVTVQYPDGEGLFSYEDAFAGSGIEVDSNNYHQQLLVRKKRVGRKTCNEVGRFEKELLEKPHTLKSKSVSAAGEINNKHPIRATPNLLDPDDFEFYRWLDNNVPADVRSDLAAMLEGIKRQQEASRSYNAKGNAKSKKKRWKDTLHGMAMREKGREGEGAAEDAPDSEPSVGDDFEYDPSFEPTAAVSGEGVPGVSGGPKRPRSAGSAQRPRTPMAAIANTLWRGGRVATPSGKKRKKLSPAQEYADLKKEIPRLVRKLEEVKAHAGVQLEVLRRKKLFYVIDGRAGEIEVDEDAYFNVQDLVEKLPPLPKEYDNDKSEEIRQKRAFRKAQYGATSFHIPTGVDIIANGGVDFQDAGR